MDSTGMMLEGAQLCPLLYFCAVLCTVATWKGSCSVESILILIGLSYRAMVSCWMVMSLCNEIWNTVHVLAYADFLPL